MAPERILARQKDEATRRLKAIQLLESLSHEDLLAVAEVLSEDDGHSKRTEKCPVCGEYFLPSGIARHRTLAKHRDEDPPLDDG